MIKLAVYGTLRRGWWNSHRIENSTFLGEFRIPGFIMYHLGGFPGVVRGDGEITVEVYNIKPEQFASCDRLEGYPSFYNRELIDTPVGKAWIYIINDPWGNKIIESGDWLNREENAQVQIDNQG